MSVVAHFDPAPSTTTVPVEPVFCPITPSREFTTAPPEIVSDPVPLLPTTSSPALVPATVIVVPAPVIVPVAVEPEASPKYAFPLGTLRVAPPDRVKAAWPEALPATNAAVAPAVDVFVKVHEPAVIWTVPVPDPIRRKLRLLAPGAVNAYVAASATVSPNPPPPSFTVPLK